MNNDDLFTVKMYICDEIIENYNYFGIDHKGVNVLHNEGSFYMTDSLHGRDISVKLNSSLYDQAGLELEVKKYVQKYAVLFKSIDESNIPSGERLRMDLGKIVSLMG